MITLDKFIEKRLKDDQKNLFDLKKKDVNLQDCVNYVFEYFNTYINIDKTQSLQIENNEKLEKYQKQVDKYSTNVQKWLIEVYSRYNKKMNQQISKLLNKMDTFLLTNSPDSFRKYSYKCYSLLIKKYHFMENYIDQLYEYIVDEHRVLNINYLDENEPVMNFNEKINNYIKKTNDKYNVNLLIWAENYASNFSEYEHMWPAGTYDNLDFGKYYNPMKAKKNRFNIDAIYSRLSTLPYIRGKKKILEILVMYYWHNQISPIEEELYKKYMKQACESI